MKHWALPLVILNLFCTLSLKSHNAYFTSDSLPPTRSLEQRHCQTCTELRGMLADMRAEQEYQRYITYMRNQEVLLSSYPTQEEINYFVSTGQLPERILQQEAEKARQQEYRHLRNTDGFNNPSADLNNYELACGNTYTEHDFARLFGTPTQELLCTPAYASVRKHMLEQFNYYQFPAFQKLIATFPEFTITMQALLKHIHNDQAYHDKLAEIGGPPQAFLTAAKQSLRHIFTGKHERHYVCCDTIKELAHKLPPSVYSFSLQTYRRLERAGINPHAVSTCVGNEQQH